MHLNKYSKFHKIFRLSTYKAYCQNLNISHHLIPIEWQIILMSDGSFTQHLNSLAEKPILTEVFYKSQTKLLYNNNLRTLWLRDHLYTKFIFAQSIWPTKLTNDHILVSKHIKPIGQSLIEMKIDISKDIHEIYYGYSYDLENHFGFKGPVWGRKYTVYSNNKPLATIQEFFSPYIINFFKQIR